MIRPEPELTYNADGTVIIKAPCVFTGEEFSVRVNASRYDLYMRGGTAIQRAFPNESPDVREFIVSGVSPKGYNEVFGEEE